jgi:hypothetical protein
MRFKICSFSLVFLTLAVGIAIGQQVQIPPLLVGNNTQVKGKATVNLGVQGSFMLEIDVRCDQTTNGFPKGSLNFTVPTTGESLLQGPLTVGERANPVYFNQLTSTGNKAPTAFLLAMCEGTTTKPVFHGWIWIMIADNKLSGSKLPDIVSFLVLDTSGKRVAYGTGPVTSGDLTVAPTTN